MSNMANAGLIYNKLLFKRINNTRHYNDDVKRHHRKLFDMRLCDPESSVLDLELLFKDYINDNVYKKLELITVWPGLLVGLGYGHATGISERGNDATKVEFKTGFYFDFTSGLPVIPGSTVKGILRSYFPGRYPTDEGKSTSNTNKRILIAKRLGSILNSLKISPPQSLSNNEWTLAALCKLEAIIFEGKYDPKKSSCIHQDTFFEAFPYRAGNGNVISGNIATEVPGVFLGEDTITPHRHPLKEPVPLRMIKILPGVTIKFQFLLNNEGIGAEEKLRLFEALLLRFGAGAKTRSGFGKFRKKIADFQEKEDWYIHFDELDTMNWDDNTHDDDEFNDDAGQARNFSSKNKDKMPPVINDEDWVMPAVVKRNDKIKGTVVESGSGSIRVRVHIKSREIYQNLSGAFSVGSEVDLVILNLEGKPEKDNFSVKVRLDNKT